MAHRKNFRRDEIATFTKGTVVEFLNGSRWVPGRILTGEVKVDSIGCKGIWVEYTGSTTRTISKGQAWAASPGAIRIPETA
jgi:hypothetical protein